MLRLLQLNGGKDHSVSGFDGREWTTRWSLYHDKPVFTKPVDEGFLMTTAFGSTLMSGIMSTGGEWKRNLQWDSSMSIAYTWSLFMHANTLWFAAISSTLDMYAFNIASGHKTKSIGCTDALPFNPLSMNDDIWVAGCMDIPACRDETIGMIKIIPPSSEIRPSKYTDAAVIGPSCVSVYSQQLSTMFIRDLRASEPERIKVYNGNDAGLTTELYPATNILPDGNIATIYVYDDYTTPSRIIMVDMRSPMEHYDIHVPYLPDYEFAIFTFV